MCAALASAGTSSGLAYSRSIRSRARRRWARSPVFTGLPGVRLGGGWGGGSRQGGGVRLGVRRGGSGGRLGGGRGGGVRLGSRRSGGVRLGSGRDAAARQHGGHRDQGQGRRSAAVLR